MLKVFVAYSGAESYDPPLWTMTYEFFGSFMVFALIAYLRPSRLRTLLLTVLFLLLTALQTYFALFVAGILIADLFPRIGASTAANRAGALLCGAGILLIALPHAWFAAVYLGGGVCLTAGAVFCAPVRRFFESRLSSFLGWVSFPLYLIQAAVIYVFAPRGLEFWLPTASLPRRSDGCSTSRLSPSRSSVRSRFARSTILRRPHHAVSAQVSSHFAMTLPRAGRGEASRGAQGSRFLV